MSLLDNAVETPDKPGDVNTPPQAPANGNREWLPEEYRSEKSLESVPDLKTLTKNYVESQKMIGGSVRIPKDDATPEEWSKFYEKLGRPGTPEDYKLEAGKLPDGMTVDPEFQGDFAKKAHELGLSVKQAQGLLGWYSNSIASKYQTNMQKMAAVTQELQQEWGPTYERNLALARRAAREFGDDSVMKMLDETGMGNHPGVIKLFARIGQNLVEDKVLTDRDTGSIMSQQTAQQKIAAIMSDPKHAYWSGDNPNHAAAVKEVEALHRLAYGRV